MTDSENVNALLAIAASYVESPAHLESTETQLARELSEIGDNRHIYVGIEADEPVAMIQLVLKNADNNPKLANGQDVAHLHNLQVRKDRQGEGFGRQMMAFIEDKARQMGKKVVTLGVDDVNARAIALYNGLDYLLFEEAEGRTQEEKCLLMKKRL